MNDPVYTVGYIYTLDRPPRFAQVVPIAPGICVTVCADTDDALCTAVTAMIRNRPIVNGAALPIDRILPLQRYRPISAYDCGDVEEDDSGEYVRYDDLMTIFDRILGRTT